jgi:hypothetical protein
MAMKTTHFDQDHAASMKQAFDEAWISMRFAGASGERAELLRDQIASIILELAAEGERNPRRLCNDALRRLPPATAYYARQVSPAHLVGSGTNDSAERQHTLR